MVYSLMYCSVLLVAVIGGCLSCPNNCKSCQRSNCDECNSGYYVNNNGRCEQCNSGCATCTGNHYWKCTSCESGYYLYSGCPQCNWPCQSCTAASSCTSCQDSMNNDWCYTCSSYCRSCASSRCTLCASGYYLNSGYCKQCGRSCHECTSSSSCTSCAFGYYLDNGICNTCGTSCHECTSSLSCTSCASGYYLNNGYCKQCSSPCQSCASSRCTSCESGYYLDNGSCMQCLSPCHDCTSPSSCTSCASGYYLDNDYCKQCGSSCHECISSSSCTSCASGYYVNNGYCRQCSSPCLSCASSRCTSCASRYYLDNGYCTQCASPCHDCTSPSSCTSCASGYYLVNGNCKQCASQCLDCTSPSSCSVCNSGHHLWNGYCYKVCKDGYYQKENECARCPTNCIGCQNTSICTNCTDDHYLNILEDGSIVCFLCDETCSTCEESQCIRNENNYNDFNGGNSPPWTTSITAGAGGAAGVLVVVIGIVVVVFYLRRSKNNQKRNANDVSSCNTVAYSHTSHGTEMEAGAVYSTPVKSEVRSNNKKCDATHLAVSATYENKCLGPELPPKITAYVHDELIEETDGLDFDPTGGRVEGVYDTYYNTGGLIRRHVTVDTLTEIVAKKSLSEYEEEFKKFPDGLARDYQDALKPENARKNRYKKVYPYDATRVVLKDGNDGDYINASYITGQTGNMAYIAALGPTVAHSDGFSLFWRMIWQEKVDKIVVLTKLNEGEKMKFERYWPLHGRTETYCPVKVQTATEKNFADFTIRCFSVSLNSQQRTVYQAHYTAWPDRSVPDNLVSLLDFRHKVEALPTRMSGPMVVHCSAGIGRTGTYIALDLLIHEGQSSGPTDVTVVPSVDVYGCVSALRGQRVNMVQNGDQYRYLHHALVHALTIDTGPLPIYEFYTCLSDEGKRRMADQFKMLQRIKRLKEEGTEIVENRKTSHTNRPAENIPVYCAGDKHRPLTTYQGKSGDSDYVNAVYLDGYVANRKFLLAQTPLQATVDDFLKLVFQEHVHYIVSMDPEDLNDKNVGRYVPPAEKELKIGTFTVRCLTCETKSNFLLRELKLQNRSGKGVKESTVQHIQYTGWTSGAQVPVSAESLVQTIGEVERTARQHREPGPIFVHCLMDAERSGLFVTVSLLMEKVTNDQAVSVVNTISQVRDRRPKAIPTVDQYIFCHECIAVISQRAEYTNVNEVSHQLYKGRTVYT